MTRGLWSFLGCPPGSLDYPGHSAPIPPISGSLVVIVGIWTWFSICSAASMGVHRWFYAQPERWLGVGTFVVPAGISVGASAICIVFAALVTMC
jgi:hypothetical protein